MARCRCRSRCHSCYSLLLLWLGQMFVVMPFKWSCAPFAIWSFRTVCIVGIVCTDGQNNRNWLVLFLQSGIICNGRLVVASCSLSLALALSLRPVSLVMLKDFMGNSLWMALASIALPGSLSGIMPGLARRVTVKQMSLIVDLSLSESEWNQWHRNRKNGITRQASERKKSVFI